MKSIIDPIDISLLKKELSADKKSQGYQLW